MADAFATRFAAVRSHFGPLVWGLDPAGSLLDAWGLGDTPDGLDRFADLVLEAATGTVGLVKLQAAFYERHGWRGFRTLQRLIAEARSAGLLVIVDAKRGDVGSTNVAYAEAYLGTDAPLGADAFTVHPYLGLGAMDAFISRAHEAGSCLLVVTRSSNPEGRVVQSATDHNGRAVEEALLVAIGELNAQLEPGEIGPIGAVVGPTHIVPTLDLVALRGLLLAPGVGMQGATASDVARVFADCPERVMPSASRSLLADGPAVSRLRDTAARLADEFRKVLSARSSPGGRLLTVPAYGGTLRQADLHRRRPRTGASSLGYDSARQDISLLSSGNLGCIQISSFVISGGLTVAFVVRRARSLKNGLGRVWGPRIRYRPTQVTATSSWPAT